MIATVLLKYFAVTAVIVYSASRLSRYADIIAERTGLGRTWIGIILLASVTSLPELVTGLSSVLLAKVPDIAVGNVIGSCVLNLLLLALLDAVYRPMPLSTRANRGNLVAAGFAMLMLSLVVLGLATREKISIGWIGVDSLVFILIYVGAMKIIHSYQKREIAELVQEAAATPKNRDLTFRQAALRFGAHSCVIVSAALFLPSLAVELAAATGLGQTFVGSIIVSISTTLPEALVSFAAIRMDAVDLAIGNHLGSIIFNILVLGIDDIAFIDGPLLSVASSDHLVSAASALAMASIAVIGLTYRAERKRFPLAWDSLSMLAIYLVNLFLLLSFR